MCLENIYLERHSLDFIIEFTRTAHTLHQFAIFIKANNPQLNDFYWKRHTVFSGSIFLKFSGETEH